MSTPDFPVTTSERQWMQEILEVEPDFYEQRLLEIGYEFSNGATFESTDSRGGGIYGY